MKILIINPNSTAAMTDKIRQCAELAARHGTKIVAVNPTDSPPAIQGPEDGDAALPHIFELFETYTANGDFDAAIIACFDDTGLWQLKAQSKIPVIGIGEAAFHTAMLRVQKFSTVTTLPVSVPVIEDNLVEYGFQSRCAKVRACDVPVLDLETDPDNSYQKLSDEIKAAIDQDHCQAIVLGCAGMADLAGRLESTHKIPVIDGVTSAVALCEMLGRAS